MGHGHQNKLSSLSTQSTGMQISIKTLANEPENITVDQDSNILGVKIDICMHKGYKFEPETLILLFKGKILKDIDRVCDYNIREGDAVLVVLPTKTKLNQHKKEEKEAREASEESQEGLYKLGDALNDETGALNSTVDGDKEESFSSEVVTSKDKKNTNKNVRRVKISTDMIIAAIRVCYGITIFYMKMVIEEDNKQKQIREMTGEEMTQFVDENLDKIERLSNLGFPEEAVINSLIQFDGDEERAIDFLFYLKEHEENT
eukprot:GHVP01048241.1.p1 GENE.GHVP01048241.1~~GHVP01048241.1.p1  ORF type:complete len:260 (+),score=57.52 GHVP01048241.1:27-806(+)